MPTVSANGKKTKPLAIFPLKTCPILSQEVMENIYITGQQNGWITGNIFNNYIEKIFVPAIQNMRIKCSNLNEPVLLIFDIHTSRSFINAKMLWENDKIIFLGLPSRSSAILQPFDLSVNAVFKSTLKSLFKSVDNESRSETRSRLMYAAHRSLQMTLNPHTIKLGCERCGLWPINPQIINENKMVIHKPTQINCINPNNRRKRGPDMSKGNILFEEENI